MGSDTTSKKHPVTAKLKGNDAVDVMHLPKQTLIKVNKITKSVTKSAAKVPNHFHTLKYEKPSNDSNLVIICYALGYTFWTRVDMDAVPRVTY